MVSRTNAGSLHSVELRKQIAAVIPDRPAAGGRQRRQDGVGKARLTQLILRWNCSEMPDQPPFDLTGTIRYQGCRALQSALKQTNIRPLPRPQKRPTKQTEIWTICRLLSALAEAGQLEYPLSVVHRDRPDILILADDKKIGVEVIEGVTPQYAEYMALAAREFPNALIEPSYFERDSPKRTIAEMRKLFSQLKPTAPGWIGDQLEQDWAAFIEEAVRTKLEKLGVPEFIKFDQNWLAIYDNTPFLMIDHEAALLHLLPRLGFVWTRYPSFDTIFIDSDPMMLEITSQGANILELKSGTIIE